MMTPSASAGTDLPVAALLRDRLDHWARVRPGDTAVTFGAQAFSWGQWRVRILRLAGALRDAGVGRGDRVAVLDLNHLATIEVTLAASSLGAATVPVNFRLSADQVRYILEDSRPVILFHGAQLAEVAAAAGADTLVPRRVVIGGDDEYEPFLAGGQPDEGADAGPDDVCLVMYTSGTTGHPKGAQLTHRGVNAHSAACCAAMSLGADSTTLVAMPLFHVGGSSYAQVGIHGGARMIWLRSAQEMRGYLNKPQATAETKTADGWIRSGDIGRTDDAGFVYVLDRVKDMIITGGENVYGPEVENVLSACPGVSEGAIIGIPDERWGEAVKAVVVPAPEAELSAADVIAFCRARLAHYQCPTSVDFVEELPRNATGKVLKRALREPYWAGRERAI